MNLKLAGTGVSVRASDERAAGPTPGSKGIVPPAKGGPATPPIDPELVVKAATGTPAVSPTPSHPNPSPATNGAGGKLEDRATGGALRERVTGGAEEAQRGAARAGGAAKDALGEYASRAQGAATEGAERLTDTAQRAGSSLQEGAARASGELKEKAGEVKGAAQRAGGRLAAEGEERLEQAADHAPPGPLKEIAEAAREAHTEERARAGAVIHDFCLGIPYGGVLAVGGIVWGLLVGSTDALRYGAICGLVISVASFLSLRAWKQRRETIMFTFAQAVVSFLVFFKEAKRFSQSGAVFPTLLTAVVSFGMVAFYAYVLLAGGNKPKVDRELSDAAGAL